MAGLVRCRFWGGAKFGNLTVIFSNYLNTLVFNLVLIILHFELEFFPQDSEPTNSRQFGLSMPYFFNLL